MDVIPSMLKSCAASGDGFGGAKVDRGVRYSRKVVGRSCGRI